MQSNFLPVARERTVTQCGDGKIEVGREIGGWRGLEGIEETEGSMQNRLRQATLNSFHSDLSLVEVADDIIVDPFFQITMQQFLRVFCAHQIRWKDIV